MHVLLTSDVHLSQCSRRMLTDSKLLDFAWSQSEQLVCGFTLCDFEEVPL